MNKSRQLLLAALAALTVGCAPSDDAIERRVDELLSRMTLQEKIGQMHQVDGSRDFERVCEAVRRGEIGSVMNVTREQIAELQRIAVEESRLGIPLIIGRDVIHGYKTVFPIPLGQAATFDPEVVREGARVAAYEASSDGIRWTFAPMMDVSRDPRWGRIAESFGEDTFLSAVMAAAAVEGFQGDDLTAPASLAACAKHYAGYGASESGRDYNSTFIPERHLRNVYLPPFEAACKAGIQTFMTSFNDNDGVPSSGSRFLLTEVLRDEWGFDGFVVSDYGAIREMIAHRFCSDLEDAAEKAVNAGLDMDMESYAYAQYLEQLVSEGKVDRRQIDRLVGNILRVKLRLGLFEHPVPDMERNVFFEQASLDAAYRAAVESAVLLKNDGVLPLVGARTVAVIGPMADRAYDQMGCWAPDGDRDHCVTPYGAFALRSDVRTLYSPAMAHPREKSRTGFADALAKVRAADAVVLFVGEEASLTGEAHSLAEIRLQGVQEELLEAVAAAGKPLVTVIMAGRPLTIGRVMELSDAVIYAFHPGTMGGRALSDLIMGDAVPSGKLPVTFPKVTGQIPIYYSQHSTGRPVRGDEMLLDDIPTEAEFFPTGFTSYWLDAGIEPLLPFGYGLSYTEFEYSAPRLSAESMAADGAITVSVDVSNRGSRDATETVQLYVQDKVASITLPVKELKDFRRVDIPAGETRTVSFELPASKLAFWNIDDRFTVEAGEFLVWAAGDSRSGEPAAFAVK